MVMWNVYVFKSTWDTFLLGMWSQCPCSQSLSHLWKNLISWREQSRRKVKGKREKTIWINQTINQNLRGQNLCSIMLRIREKTGLPERIRRKNEGRKEEEKRKEFTRKSWRKEINTTSQARCPISKWVWYPFKTCNRRIPEEKIWEPTRKDKKISWRWEIPR